MENNYAEIPASKPSNTAIYQLPAVSVGGSKFYGWKMVYFKSVDTGKKDKNGKEIIKSVPDKARPVTYDIRTQQMQNQKASNATMIQLMTSMAKQQQQAKNQNATIINLMTQIAKLKNGGNK